MPQAAKRIARKTTHRKTRKPLLRMSPLGREFLAAIIEYQRHSWLDPERGCVSEEVAEDDHYRAAYNRAWSRKLREVDRLQAAIMAQPLSLANLADRALIQHQFYGGPAPIESYLPGGKGEVGNELAMPAIAAIVALSDIPAHMPAMDDDEAPPDAEARILAMLGKRRPKRKALSSGEQKAIADAAVADAIAAISKTADLGPAPLLHRETNP